MSSTPKLFKQGDRREDGYLFSHYDKKGVPMFRSPEGLDKRRIAGAVVNARKRAKAQGLPFDIDAEYAYSIFPTNRRCPVLGIELVWGSDTARDVSPSLDKIIPELGYVKGNVVWVSQYVNRIKSDASMDTLKRIVHFYDNIPEGN